MTNPSKRKGSGYELEIVRDLQELGLAAEKMPMSGQLGGKYSGDVSVPVQGQDWRAECKRRAREFGRINGYLGSNDVLFCRDDRSRTLVVMTIDQFARLAKGQAA